MINIYIIYMFAWCFYTYGSATGNSALSYWHIYRYTEPGYNASCDLKTTSVQNVYAEMQRGSTRYMSQTAAIHPLLMQASTGRPIGTQLIQAISILSCPGNHAFQSTAAQSKYRAMSGTCRTLLVQPGLNIPSLGQRGSLNTGDTQYIRCHALCHMGAHVAVSKTA